MKLTFKENIQTQLITIGDIVITDADTYLVAKNNSSLF